MKELTLETAYFIGVKSLEDAGIMDAKLDAWYLLEYHFHINRAHYLMNAKEEITKLQLEEYSVLIRKRANHIPLQYITSTQEFMGLTFFVSPSVLIPRQDTEVLVEEVMKEAAGKEVLDLCTGSGCIITSLSTLCSLKSATATDISVTALEIATKNIEYNQATVTLIQSDLFENVTGTYDIIVSNPPYIPTEDINELMEEVKNHEPILALDGKGDGLYFYRKITKEAVNYLNCGGQIFFEIGYNQSVELKEILDEAGFIDIRIIKDLSGLDRVVRGRLK